MKRSSWASGSEYVPSCSMGFCVASTKNGSGSLYVLPAAVRRCSCIASSSAACVFGGARLISSASTMLANTGPFVNWKVRLPVPWSSSSSSVPVMSLGIRSGVNWMREKDWSSASATVWMSSVFASPGTPIRMTCPPERIETTRLSTMLCIPTMRRPISAESALWAVASVSSNARACSSAGSKNKKGARFESCAPDDQTLGSVVSAFAVVRSAHHELRALLHRVVLALQRRDGDIAAAGRVVPEGVVLERVAGAEHLVLQRLREHPAGAPAPYFAAERVEHDELVRLAAWEVHLELLVARVEHAESEAHVDLDLDVERCGERGSAGLRRALCVSFCGGITAARPRPAREREDEHRDEEKTEAAFHDAGRCRTRVNDGTTRHHKSHSHRRGVGIISYNGRSDR